jgi:hypothetical protein
MPIHDWTRVEAGDFCHSHHAWVVFLTNALNGGLLPDEFMYVVIISTVMT